MFKSIRKRIKQYFYAWFHKNDPKVFCISMQRTGTTSVGKFFQDVGYRWTEWLADYKNK